VSDAEIEAGLVEVLAPTLGAVAVEDLRRLSAGANRQTWAFDAVTDAGRVPLVLQAQRPGGNRTGTEAAEAAVLRHAHAGGVTVPEVVAADVEPNPLGRDFTISARHDGESIARRILRDERFAPARASFVTDCARELAAIHALDVEPMASTLLPVDDPVAAQAAVYHRFDDPHPVFDLALRWLDETRPELSAPAVVHGDFRMGNLLIGDAGITAVLDWELCHLGDPAADLGWLVARPWRFGGDGEVGGIGSRRALLDAYREAGGRAITLDELRWWEVHATLRWGAACMFMVGDHLAGRSRSVERATIGRRVAEVEYDVLLLLGEVLT